ncbi:MAG: hypothetical protein U0822_04240 [Anaerolineae bacterium]
MLDEILRNSAVQTVIQAISTFKLWIYGFALLGGLIALRAVLRARTERSRAMFGLEREAASGRLSSAIFTLLLMAALAGGVYVVTNYFTADAISQRTVVRAQAQATATAQARATESAVVSATRAAAPTSTPQPATATPPPRPTDTPAPTTPPDLTQSCHGEGDAQGMRYVDRQGVNLRKTPEQRGDNIERTLPFSTEVCVYGDENGWLKVTVANIEGYRYILKDLTRP